MRTNIWPLKTYKTAAMAPVHSLDVSLLAKRNIVSAASGMMSKAAILMPAGSPKTAELRIPQINGTAQSAKFAMECPCMKLALHHGMPSVVRKLCTTSFKNRPPPPYNSS